MSALTLRRFSTSSGSHAEAVTPALNLTRCDAVHGLGLFYRYQQFGVRTDHALPTRTA